MTAPNPVTSRREMLDLLAQAAELEHGIACSYLYAAFSLKRNLSEGGMGWEEQQAVRRWAAQIYFVASQEMLHLALVWNMTTAIGGRPYPLRPNFPQNSKYYDFHLPIELEPFGEKCVHRFIGYEHPAGQTPPHVQGIVKAGGGQANLAFSSIGELYALIRSGFETIPDDQLFIGSPGQQVTSAQAHFPDLIVVSDRKSAVAAVDEIVRQGEGIATDRVDSHFGVFVSILEEFREISAKNAGFDPVRSAMRNPVTDDERGSGSHANTISDPLALRAARLFDGAYELMLCMLAWSFELDSASASDLVAKLCESAIDFMPRVLLPLGEGLMLMPSGNNNGGKTAGPAFALTRPLLLAHKAEHALRVCRERFGDLAADARSLRADAVPAPVKRACGHIVEMESDFLAATKAL